MFSVSDRVAIQEALNLDLDEVRDGSVLALSLTEIENLDTELGSNKEGTIKAILTELQQISNDIVVNQKDSNYGVASYRVDVKDEYSKAIDYGSSNSSSTGLNVGLMARKQDLINSLRRDLRIVRGGRIPLS
ncbi:MAG: hypothetical protein J7647_32130 [Cyanobacteria bacterium SBLK]|nr:hypothetical protein [Cyanobacteria bacterium SBLK]